ncbi:SusC/RagA family TonB-linked outer membrane protein [Parachryseolinea silvisoli]|uniref:SusC/RagA family TonB-linked outer membrane protein n=1 Tax=Parachryseolinea silvisoli TaxID=2873601 RepID=UPI002265F34A|nr:SusC/RagA family TonB-linked outer membrane protein [Parachryseolinea silvisoli]MCD9018605.1 SusC/RagA family TonB-linked outer membrane protein [Parachryseolinea silvisoli]
MRRSLRLTSLLFLWLTTAVAYGQSVTGRVTSASDGSAMPGVSVLLKGSTVGAATDTEGRFTLSVPDVSNATLTISFIGYATQDVPLAGRTSIDVVLTEDISQLNEVVVTALGVQREAKTLVYSTQTVKAQQLTEVRDANNFVNSLQGKIANVQITQGSGGPGSGARFVMRGNRSLQGSNNALIVVDGIPINNVSLSPASNDFGAVQNSDGASNINPDDIESVTVLRGASAAALYGSEAGNGVVVITTKKGTKDRFTVNINSGITAEKPFTLPAVQNTYGQGIEGALTMASGNSWGARMNGQTYTNLMGQERTYSPQEDNIKDFFKTGVTLNNSISVQGGSEKMQTYLSYTNNNVKGIIPNNDLKRHTTTVRLTNQISSKFSTDAKLTYIYQDIDSRPRTGEENAPVSDLYQVPRSMSIGDVKQYLAPIEVGTPAPAPWPATLSSIYQNPYWMTEMTSINETRNRIMGFISAKYEFSKKFGISGRANLDKQIDMGNSKYSDGTLLWATTAGGLYERMDMVATQQWYDLNFYGAFDLNKDLKLDYRAGAIYQDKQHERNVSQANGLNVPNLFLMSNGKSFNYPYDASNLFHQQVQAVFGQLSFAYKEAIFLEVTGRNDWFSSLPDPYNVFYPSVGLSGVISDLVTMPQAISFLKLNANFAVVGNGGQPFIINPSYPYEAGAGNGFLHRQYTQALADLKPEEVTNIEFGFDARFLEGRLGLTFSYYKSNSRNQLLQARQPVGTGYESKYFNAGNIQNQGIEAVLSGTPVKSGDFSWDITYNFGLNRNKVIEIDPSLPDGEFFLGGGTGYGRLATPIAVKGGSYGDLYGKHWVRNDDGQLVVTPNGLPTTDGQHTRLGNFNPKATMGITNSFTYKNFSARVLIDGRIGGIVVDATEMNLANSGIAEVTASNREEGWNLGGVDSNGTPVATNVTAEQFWSAGDNVVAGKRYGVGEVFAYDATNFRIRELSIGYNIPVPSNFLIRSAKFSIVARNLAWLYRGESLLDIPGLGKRKMQIDPDMSMGNGNYQGIQIATLPSTRSLGCNLTLTF